MTSTLEALLNPAVDLQPALTAYRAGLRACAEAGRSVDEFADRLAEPARRLGLSAVAIRDDHAQFLKLLRLEQRFDAGELSRLEEELERRRKLDMLYSQSGFECQRRGYVQDDDGQPYKCERDRRFDVLQPQYDASTAEARLAVVAEMELVRAEADRLAVARRQTEEQVIATLNSQDRLSAFRRGNRRLFPESDD